MLNVAVQRAPDDVRVGDVVADGADRGEHAAPAGAPDREPAVGRVEVGGEAPVAVDQEAVEAEDLHFLRRLDAGAGLAHVVELAPLRRAQVVERVALRVEVRLAEERRHQRQRQQHDQPRRVEHQRRGEAQDGDDVLRLAEHLAHQRAAADRLPARALQPVLQLAVLEVLEVERRRVLHQAQAGGVGELLRQQRVEQRHRAPEHVGQHREPELDGEQQRDAVDAARSPATADSVSVADAEPAMPTTSSMISLPT